MATSDEYKFLTISEQIDRLKTRNLNIKNYKLLESYLEKYNYENFVNLYYKFLSKPNTKTFLDGVSSDILIDIFDFDRKLSIRLLSDVLELERIITTKLIYFLPQYFYENRQRYSNNDNEIMLEIESLKNGTILTLSSKTLCSIFPKLSNNEQNYNVEDFLKNIKQYVPINILNDNPSIWKIAIYWSTGTLRYIYDLLDDDTRMYFIKQFNFDVPIYPSEMYEIIYMLNNLRNRICHNNAVYDFKFHNTWKDKNGNSIFPQPIAKLIKRFYKYKPNKIRIRQVTEIFDIFIKSNLTLDVKNILNEFCDNVNNKVLNNDSKDKIIKILKEYMRYNEKRE